jgi:LmbE family N-acetylglucosaminyl deacetylase
MLRLAFDAAAGAPRQILCLGAHSDDIEIGCGGALLKLAAQHPNVVVHWVVFSARGLRRQEAEQSAEAFLSAVTRKTIVVHDFRDGYFPYMGDQIKDCFEVLKLEVDPDLIFTHCRHDLHQDHRLLAELTGNTFRNHLVLEYEIPKYDGDLRTPNVYIHLDRMTAERKVELLFRHFFSQTSRFWFTPETFLSLMRLRGLESRAAEGFAEGFYAHKLVLG